MAYLVLSNGQIFEGRRIGAPVDRVGELVFTTGMEGYIETLTDPSYYGQIVTQSFPLIGNYGMIEEDFEGQSALFGYIVRELCDAPSNFRCQGTVDEYLKSRGIPGLCGVDTREIVRVTREQGVMNAMICDRVPDDLSAIKDYLVQNAVQSVTCTEKTVYPAVGGEKYRVALIDYGAKRNIIRSLQRRGCQVTVWPAATRAETLLADEPDGIMLSNGPGDPKENTGCIAEIRKLLGQKPLFGICLGHQLTALALGGDTVKLHYGHRGGNHHHHRPLRPHFNLSPRTLLNFLYFRKSNPRARSYHNSECGINARADRDCGAGTPIPSNSRHHHLASFLAEEGRDDADQGNDRERNRIGQPTFHTRSPFTF